MLSCFCIEVLSFAAAAGGNRQVCRKRQRCDRLVVDGAAGSHSGADGISAAAQTLFWKGRSRCGCRDHGLGVRDEELQRGGLVCRPVGQGGQLVPAELSQALSQPARLVASEAVHGELPGVAT